MSYIPKEGKGNIPGNKREDLVSNLPRRRPLEGMEQRAKAVKV